MNFILDVFVTVVYIVLNRTGVCSSWPLSFIRFLLRDLCLLILLQHRMMKYCLLY